MIKFFKKHKFKFLYSGVGIAVFYALFGFFALPYIVKNLLPSMLENRANFSVEDVKFNPFTYELNITKPKFSTYKPLFSANQVDVKLKFGELFNKTIDVENLYLYSPKISISRENNGSFNFEPLYVGNENEADRNDENSTINVRLDSFKIVDGNVSYSDEYQIKPFKIDLGEINYEINGLNLADKTIGKHDFNATSKTFENIAYKGAIDIYPLKIYGEVDVKKLKINPFWLSFLDMENLELIDGALSLKTAYELSFDENVGLKFTDTYLRFDDLAILQDKNLIKLSALEIPKTNFNSHFSDETAGHIETSNIAFKNAAYLSDENNATVQDLNISNFALNFSNKKQKFSLDGKFQDLNISKSAFNADDLMAKIGEIGLKNFDLNLTQNSDLNLQTALKNASLNDVKFQNSIVLSDFTLGKISQISTKIQTENNATKILANSETIDISPINVALVKTDKIKSSNFKADDFSFFMDNDSSDLTLKNAVLSDTSVTNKNETFAGIKSIKLSESKFGLDTLALNIANIAIDEPFFNSIIDESGAKSVNELSIIKPLPKTATNKQKFQKELKTAISRARNNAYIDDQNITFALLSDINATKISIQSDKNATADLNNTAQNFSSKKTQNKKPANFSFNIANIAINNGKTKITESFVTKNMTHEINAINATLSGLSSNFAKQLDAKLSFASKELNAKSNGKITINPLNLNIDFDAALPDIRLANPYLKEFLNAKLTSGSIGVNGNFKLDKEFLLSSSMNAKNVVLNGAKNDKIFAVQNAKVSKIALNQKGINIAGISVDSPFAKIHIAKDKTINVANIAKENKTSKGKKQSSKKSNFALNIKDINLQNGAINFIDDSLFMPFDITVSKIKTSIDKINDKNLADVKFSGVVGKNGLGQISVKTTPFAYQNKTDLNLVLKDVALKDVTPYSAKFVGYEIKDGKINLRLNYKINASKLSATNDINLDNLTLGDKVESKEALNLPLDLAISLLKDSNNQIDISLPVGGNLNDPKFNFGGVIMGAVTKLFSDIVLSPFRFLGKIAGIDTKGLDSIDFESGSAEILSSEISKIENLASIIKQKPELKITLTPTYNEKIDTFAFKKDTLNQTLTLMANKDGLSYDEAMAKFKTKYNLKFDGEELYNAVVEAQKFTPSRLDDLAQTRVKNIKKELAKFGVDDTSVVIKKVSKADAKQDSFVPVYLGMQK